MGAARLDRGGGMAVGSRLERQSTPDIRDGLARLCCPLVAVLQGSDLGLSSGLLHLLSSTEMGRRPFDFAKKTVQLVWKNAPHVPGRDPKRWRFDAIGRPTLETMRSRCTGIFTHQYDHVIAPITDKEKEDKRFARIENCQLLSAKVNAGKKAQNDLTKEELEDYQHFIRATSAFLDLIEVSQYGNVVNEKGRSISKCFTIAQMNDSSKFPALPPFNLSQVVETFLEEARAAEEIWLVEKEYKRGKQKPIWMRNHEEISDEEYAGFFKCLTSKSEEHLAMKHVSVEGQLKFKAILFVPKRAPSDLFDTRRSLDHIKLYARPAFIMVNCEELIPEWLSFIKGVIDSEDLHAIVSPNSCKQIKISQQNKILKTIRKILVKKCVELFFDISENKEDYDKFYEAFSKNLKLGIHENLQNKKRVAKLLRYHSTKSGDEMTSLKIYVTRMKKGQSNIYYISGVSKKAVETSPVLEKLKKKGYEVLFMLDPIDECTIIQLKDFRGKKLVSATNEGLELDESEYEKKRKEELQEKFEGLCKVIKEVLGDKVEKVVVSDRLVDSACCLVTSEDSWTANMERMTKAQALKDSNISVSAYMSSKILEINPDHAIIDYLRKRIEVDKSEKSVKDLAVVLFEAAHLTCSVAIEDPRTFGSHIFKMIKLGMSIDEDKIP